MFLLCAPPAVALVQQALWPLPALVPPLQDTSMHSHAPHAHSLHFSAAGWASCSQGRRGLLLQSKPWTSQFWALRSGATGGSLFFSCSLCGQADAALH